MRFADEMFTPAVKAVQAKMGSRRAYERFERDGHSPPDPLGLEERAFVAARDSFYMATVSESGWPYVQFRGGLPGFLKVLDPATIGFADYRGNRQYISVGNLAGDARVSLILMDYPNRRRLKIIGHARILAEDDTETLARLQDDYAAKIERGIVIAVDGFDWNCPQHITPRFTEAEIEAAVRPLRERLAVLERDNEALRGRVRD